MFDLDIALAHLPYLLKGAGVSVSITLGAIALGLLLGILFSQMRMSKIWLITVPVRVYISIVRGTPFIIQLFIVYYGLSLIGFTLPAWLVGTIALAVNSAAYQAEYFRAGMESIPQGYEEAGRSLGMTRLQILRRIKLPVVMAKIIPPLTNEFILVLKNSAIVSIISVVELMRVGQQIISTTSKPTEIYLLIAAIYIIVNLSIMSLFRLLERKQSIWLGRNGGRV